MIGNLWSTGLEVTWCGKRLDRLDHEYDVWTVALDFQDSGFAQDDGVKGRLELRYVLRDLPTMVMTLVADAIRLGIRLNLTSDDRPDFALYLKRDAGVTGEYPTKTPRNIAWWFGWKLYEEEVE